ncbi:hypothetical protein SAMN04487911_11527 [Arenibacter nanhaiticus]|uniref:Uncharacterized protein n=1 Tax=Arenibacter nanhaiticus TaxID=558155 RepID=A0A1M6HUW5_9FLAO|nr:hypothetical protein [Arenibacter nanhaiticus]SHJ25908.1 hypothetical protein SAMN04487911_11527 [Arenibacter nanhaiticus]
MNSSALIIMLLAQGTMISLAGYFFYRVLTTPPKQEPDSYYENDDIENRQKE